MSAAPDVTIRTVTPRKLTAVRRSVTIGRSTATAPTIRSKLETTVCYLLA